MTNIARWSALVQEVAPITVCRVPHSFYEFIKYSSGGSIEKVQLPLPTGDSRMREIVPILPHQVSPQLRALFDEGQPLAIRCFSVLDGSICGQIWTDDLAHPTWGAALELAYGVLFLGGRPDANLVHELIEKLSNSAPLPPNPIANAAMRWCAVPSLSGNVRRAGIPPTGIAPKATWPRLAWHANWGIRPKKSFDWWAGMPLSNRIL